MGQWSWRSCWWKRKKQGYPDMIEDGQLVYGLSESRLLSWELQNPILRALLAALFSTILSYQVAAAITDVLLGRKPSGEAKVTDIGILLLSQEGTPLSFFRNVLPIDKAIVLYQGLQYQVYRRLYRGEKWRPSDEGLQQNAIKMRVWLKLWILLLVAPVVNLLAVAITVETENELTFANMNFGGMAVGINDDLSFLPFSNSFATCSEYIPKRLDDRETYIARFFVCDEYHPQQLFTTSPLPVEDDKAVAIQIGTFPGGIISFSLTSAGQKEEWWFYSNIQVKNKIYRLREQFSIDNAKTVMANAERGIKKVLCRAELQQTKIGEDLTFSGDNFMLTSTFAQCHEDIFGLIPFDQQISYFAVISLAFTFIDSQSMQVALEERPSFFPNRTRDFFPADSLPLILRRRSIVSPAVLGILAAVSLVLRAIINVMTNNDIDNGIKLLVKKAQGLRNDASMLRSQDMAYYGPHDLNDRGSFW